MKEVKKSFAKEKCFVNIYFQKINGSYYYNYVFIYFILFLVTGRFDTTLEGDSGEIKWTIMTTYSLICVLGMAESAIFGVR